MIDTKDFNIHPKYEDQSYKLAAHTIKNIRRAFVSQEVSVQISSFYHTVHGEVVHLWIRRHDSKPLGWTQLQRIKNEILGEDQLCVQVFPKQSDVVDQANMYHLWSFDSFNIEECGFKF